MTTPTQDELLALGLDDATLDAQMRDVMARLRAEGRDPEAVVARAGEVLSAWREQPAPFASHAGGDVATYVAGFSYACLCNASTGTGPIQCPEHPRPHLYEPTTNTRCARCNRPREEH